MVAVVEVKSEPCFSNIAAVTSRRHKNIDASLFFILSRIADGRSPSTESLRTGYLFYTYMHSIGKVNSKTILVIKMGTPSVQTEGENPDCI